MTDIAPGTASVLGALYDSIPDNPWIALEGYVWSHPEPGGINRLFRRDRKPRPRQHDRIPWATSKQPCHLAKEIDLAAGVLRVHNDSPVDFGSYDRTVPATAITVWTDPMAEAPVARVLLYNMVIVHAGYPVILIPGGLRGEGEVRRGQA